MTRGMDPVALKKDFGGGLILASSQHVQLDTPVENFLAMVAAVRETPCT